MGFRCLSAAKLSFPLTEENPLPQLISRCHAAQRLDVSTQLLDKLVRQGKLRAFRLGRRVLYDRCELLKLLGARDHQGDLQ